MMTYQLIAALTCGIFDRWRGTDDSWLPNRVECALYGVAALFALLGTDAVNYLSDWKFALIYLLLFIFPTGWGAAVGAGLGNLSRKEFIEKVKEEKLVGHAEYYLVGPMAKSWKLALVYRGFQWGFLPSLALYYYIGLAEAVAMTLAFTVAMPCAILLSNAIEGSKASYSIQGFSNWMTKDKDRWAEQELLRGWMVGTILVLASFII